MEAWIPITVAAAFTQNLRSVLQKQLKGRLSTVGAAYVRFLYACPLALAYLWGLHAWGGMTLPTPNLTFAAYIFVGAVAQMLFTALLVWLFALRNFVVGAAYSKTETVQIAILGFIFLGDGLSIGAIVAIAMSAAGVMTLSAGQSGLSMASVVRGLRERSTLVGLTSGFCLGVTSVAYRGASLSLGHESVVMAAAFSMAVSLLIQTFDMRGYLLLREPGQMTAVVRAWRPAGLTGIVAMLASVGWMTAVAMENAAHVRALGQIELLFTFAASTLFFREKSTRLELVGVALIALGIVVLLLYR